MSSYPSNSCSYVISHRKMITTEAIDRYNRAAVSVLDDADSPAVIWTSMQSLVEEFYDDMPDGLHIPVKALKQAIQASVYFSIFGNVQATGYWSEFG